jgi:hypothetical protein
LDIVFELSTTTGFSSLTLEPLLVSLTLEAPINPKPLLPKGLANLFLSWTTFCSSEPSVFDSKPKIVVFLFSFLVYLTGFSTFSAFAAFTDEVEACLNDILRLTTYSSLGSLEGF